jgi:broad specificity phosphatase PhoE
MPNKALQQSAAAMLVSRSSLACSTAAAAELIRSKAEFGWERHLSMLIKLVGHGESLANVGAVNPAEVGDHTIALTPLGKEQAREAGQHIGPDFLDGALAYCSPFRRARETLAGLLEGAGVSPVRLRVYEDPRLRKVEHGYADVRAQEPLRRTHGCFYYRFHGGESPADCYDRTSGFLESLMRQAERKRAGRVLVVTHGLTIRCFVMRFLHLTVEQFDTMANPANCDIITLGPKEAVAEPLFSSGRWSVSGLRIRAEEEAPGDHQ